MHDQSSATCNGFETSLSVCTEHVRSGREIVQPAAPARDLRRWMHGWHVVILSQGLARMGRRPRREEIDLTAEPSGDSAAAAVPGTAAGGFDVLDLTQDDDEATGAAAPAAAAPAVAAVKPQRKRKSAAAAGEAAGAAAAGASAAAEPCPGAAPAACTACHHRTHAHQRSGIDGHVGHVGILLMHLIDVATAKKHKAPKKQQEKRQNAFGRTVPYSAKPSQKVKERMARAMPGALIR